MTSTQMSTVIPGTTTASTLRRTKQLWKVWDTQVSFWEILPHLAQAFRRSTLPSEEIVGLMLDINKILVILILLCKANA